MKLRLPKNFDEIIDSVLLPNDWYTLRLTKPPQLLPNGALRDYMKQNNFTAKGEELYDVADIACDYQNDNNQFAGVNLVLDLRVVSDNSEHNGRAFRIYLPMPNKGDKHRITPLGQPAEDAKLARIRSHLLAFRPDADEDTELLPGDSAQFYITTRLNERMQREESTIDINVDPIPVS